MYFLHSAGQVCQFSDGWTFAAYHANLGHRARYPSGKGEVCKTCNIHTNKSVTVNSNLVSSVGFSAFYIASVLFHAMGYAMKSSGDYWPSQSSSSTILN